MPMPRPSTCWQTSWRGSSIAALASTGRTGKAGNLGRGHTRGGPGGVSSSSRSSAPPRPIRPALSGEFADILVEMVDVGPLEQELARARNRLEAGWRWEQEDLAGLAAGIGHAALWGNWRDWQTEHAATLAVDAAAIQRVARSLTDDTSQAAGPSPDLEKSSPDLTRGGSSSSTQMARTRTSPIIRDHYRPVRWIHSTPGCHQGSPSFTPLDDYHPRRSRLENGLRVIHERRPETGVVALELHLDAGWVREGRPGTSYLTGRLLEEGTRNRTAQELAAAIEDAGGSMEVTSACASLRVRAEDLALAIEILADLVRHPVFPAEAVDWAKQRIIAELQADMEDPAHRADSVFRRLIYGQHPLGRDPRGSLRDVRSLTRNDVVDHHARTLLREPVVSRGCRRFRAQDPGATDQEPCSDHGPAR